VGQRADNTKFEAQRAERGWGSGKHRKRPQQGPRQNHQRVLALLSVQNGLFRQCLMLSIFACGGFIVLLVIPGIYFLGQAGYVFTLFICLLAELRKNYSADFHDIRRKGGAGQERTQHILMVIRITLCRVTAPVHTCRQQKMSTTFVGDISPN